MGDAGVDQADLGSVRVWQDALLKSMIAKRACDTQDGIHSAITMERGGHIFVSWTNGKGRGAGGINDDDDADDVRTQ